VLEYGLEVTPAGQALAAGESASPAGTHC
jgi:hypothetical protein